MSIEWRGLIPERYRSPLLGQALKHLHETSSNWRLKVEEKEKSGVQLKLMCQIMQHFIICYLCLFVASGDVSLVASVQLNRTIMAYQSLVFGCGSTCQK